MWALLLGGCARHPQVLETHQITVYYCKGGSQALVPLRFAVASKLNDQQLAAFAVNQLLAGPSVLGNDVVLFPAGTRADVALTGDTATVDLRGPIADNFHGGTSEETAMFKSLTYTLTGLPNVERVQVLVKGQRVAALPGGQFALDEPLTRDTFAQ
mgnify:CR=1 FL=1